MLQACNGVRRLNSIALKMKSTALLLTALLLPSCAWNAWPSASRESANTSALYDPPTVTLVDGQSYQFQEGILQGRGQRFHSDYSYRRAVIIGNASNP